MTIDNYINGVNFQRVADFVIDRLMPVSEWDILINKIKDKRKAIIWCKTDYAPYLFAMLQNVRGSYYTLITHCSDYGITKDFFDAAPDCIYKWFAQNVDYSDSDLIPIPIGVENHTGPSKGTCIDVDFLGSFLPPAQRAETIYCNFSTNTHSSRPAVLHALQQQPMNTCVFDSGKSYSQYMTNMCRCQYVASPRGNGIDCHRTWEALYMGCVPIVDRHPMYDVYKLPIIQVDKWDDIHEVVAAYKQPVLTSNDQLHIAYWLKLIKDLHNGDIEYNNGDIIE